MATLSDMEVARGNLLIKSPFYGAIAMRLEQRIDRSQPTAYTDGKILGFNPEWFAKLHREERKGLVAHDVLHVVLLHPVRRGNRDRDLWNVACDYAINQELLTCEFQLPEGALVSARFTGLGAEQIYDILKGNGEDGTEGSEQKPCPWGEVRDATDENGQPVPQSEMSIPEQEIKVMVTQAIQQSKACGRMPGSLERLLGERLQAKLNWRDILREFVLKAQSNTSDWSRPNRRLIGQGMYLPRNRSDALKIAIAIDTSGSISQSNLDTFLSEIRKIVEEFSMTGWLISCDCQINEILEVSSQDFPEDYKPKGGGGTDFSPVFKWAEDLDEKPDCIVYLTDTYGYFPPEPDIATVWVKTTTANCPWGMEVLLDDN